MIFLLTKKYVFLDNWTSNFEKMSSGTFVQTETLSFFSKKKSFSIFENFLQRTTICVCFQTFFSSFLKIQNFFYQTRIFFSFFSLHSFKKKSFLFFFSQANKNRVSFQIPKNFFKFQSKFENNSKKNFILKQFLVFSKQRNFFFQKLFFYTFSFFQKKNWSSFPAKIFFFFFESFLQSRTKKNIFSLFQFQNRKFFFSRIFSSFFLMNFFSKEKNDDLSDFQQQKKEEYSFFSKFPFYNVKFFLKKTKRGTYFSACASLAFLFYKESFHFFSSSLFQHFSFFSSFKKILFEFSKKKKVFLDPIEQKRKFGNFSLFFFCLNKTYIFKSKKKFFLKELMNLLKKYCNKNFSIFFCKNNGVDYSFSSFASTIFFPFLFQNKNSLTKNFSHFFLFNKFFWRLSDKFFFLPTVFQTFQNFAVSPILSNFFVVTTFFSFVGEKTKKTLVFLNFFKEFQSKEVFSKYLLIFQKKIKKYCIIEHYPTLKNIKNHLKKCQKTIIFSQGKSQIFLMKKLEKLLFSWSKIYSKITSKKILIYCDFVLFQYLWKWAKKTHPNKNKTWIRKKYFFFLNSKFWFFGFKKGKKRIGLPLHSQRISKEKRFAFFCDSQ